MKDNDFNKHFGYLELNDDSKETRSTSKSKRNKSRKSADDTEYNIRNATDFTPPTDFLRLDIGSRRSVG